MAENKREAVIVAYGRSAVTKGRKGEFAHIHPIEYGGQVLKGVLEKIPQLDPKDIDEVVYGCTNLTDHQSYDVAKMICARAGLPASVPAITVSRFCSSGSDAIALAAARVISGMADIAVGGGIESMSLVPQPNPETRHDYQWLVDNVDKDIYLHVGLCAENTARKLGMTREESDSLAVLSHQRAAAAQAAGKFDCEIIPVTVPDAEGNMITVTKDGGIRPDTSLEGLAKLKPVFDPNGIIHAGASSQVSDGTGCLVIMTREKAEELGLKPLFRFVGYQAGCAAPGFLTEGLLAAIDRVVKRTGISLDEISLFEINEAFSPAVREFTNAYGISMDKINVNGGAMALGHPLGATGAFLACKIFSELERRQERYGMVAMCAAIGHGGAAIYERL